MCSTKRIAITFSINLKKYVRNRTKVFQNIAVKCIFLKIVLTTADLNATRNDAVEQVKLIIQTITSINK